jgi:hypothetical protein
MIPFFSVDAMSGPCCSQSRTNLVLGTLAAIAILALTLLQLTRP